MTDEREHESWNERDRLLFSKWAFDDTEGTIRATDAKASIALVVHGFLFAGVVGVISRSGSILENSTGPVELTALGLIAVASIFFLVSVTQLIRTIVPSAKDAASQPVDTTDAFYLPVANGWWSGEPTSTPSFKSMKQKHKTLDWDTACDEMVAEWFKVSLIRAKKVRLAKSGMQALLAEIVVAVAMMFLLGTVALTGEDVATRASSSEPPAPSACHICGIEKARTSGKLKQVVPRP